MYRYADTGAYACFHNKILSIRLEVHVFIIVTIPNTFYRFVYCLYVTTYNFDEV